MHLSGLDMPQRGGEHCTMSPGKWLQLGKAQFPRLPWNGEQRYVSLYLPLKICVITIAAFVADGEDLQLKHIGWG